MLVNTASLVLDGFARKMLTIPELKTEQNGNRSAFATLHPYITRILAFTLSKAQKKGELSFSLPNGTNIQAMALLDSFEKLHLKQEESLC